MKRMRWFACILLIIIAVPVFAGEQPVGEIAVSCYFDSLHRNRLYLYNAADGVNRVIKPDFTGDRAAWSSDGDYMYYFSFNDMWRMNVTGTTAYDYQNLTEGGVSGGQPACSPDGKYIAFIKDGQAWRMSSGGTGAVQLTFHETGEYTGSAVWPSWSPDGKQIVYSFGGYLYIIGWDGEELDILTEGRSPSWSPGANRVAYVYESDLYVFNIGTGEERRLTDNADAPDERKFFVENPVWSPDGRHLAFISNIDHFNENTMKYESFKYDVYLISVDSTGLTRLSELATLIRSIAWRPVDVPVDVDETPRPGGAILHENRPNPFNPRTVIPFDLAAAGHVRLTVHDILGRTVVTLVNRPMSPGRHEAVWNADDMASGVYFARLETADYGRVRKMTLMK